MTFEFLAQARSSGSDDLLQHMPLFVEGNDARFKPGHVEQIIHQSGQAPRFIDDALEKALSSFFVRYWAAFEETGACPGNSGQRSAKVVRNRTQKGTAQLLCLN